MWRLNGEIMIGYNHISLYREIFVQIDSNQIDFLQTIKNLFGFAIVIFYYKYIYSKILKLKSLKNIL